MTPERRLYMLILAIIYGILIIALYKSNQKKKIYYNNYQQCLRALADSDPKLAEYLKCQKNKKY